MPNLNPLSNRVQIDLEDIMVAMQTHDFDVSHYLDVTTGAILLVKDGMVNDLEGDIDDLLDEEPDRYRLVEPVESSTAYKVMEDFIDALPHGVAQTVLRHAIEKPKPFRGFKDALVELTEAQDQWVEFELKAYRRYAEKWLQLEGIEATLVLGLTPKSDET